MHPISLIAVVLAGALLAGCGGSGHRAAATTTATTATAPTGTSTGPSPLQAEAASAAAGDIPDNQVFVALRNTAAGYSIKYPEGWAQRGAGKNVTFRDKNNVVRVVIRAGGPRSAAQIRQELRGVKVQKQPEQLSLAGSQAFKVVYTTEGAPNPVTGKRVTLQVDRYYLPHGSGEAVVDLGAPVGVDNVDAYRLMIESFKWR